MYTTNYTYTSINAQDGSVKQGNSLHGRYAVMLKQVSATERSSRYQQK